MRYFQKEQLALFEVADLVGLEKIPLEKRNPLQIQTCGIGELIRHLIAKGLQKSISALVARPVMTEELGSLLV